MDDFASLEKNIVRELSCRLCLCTDVVKLKPLSSEVKRKLKKLFDIVVRTDDSLPKAICHDCLQQVGTMHLYAVKVEKTQKFLSFHKTKAIDEKREQNDKKLHPIIGILSVSTLEDRKKSASPKPTRVNPSVFQQGDSKSPNLKQVTRKKTPLEMKYMESMSMDEFAKAEKIDKSLFKAAGNMRSAGRQHSEIKEDLSKSGGFKNENADGDDEMLDPVVIVDGRPAKSGSALDKQITMFFKMECCICHENGFQFRSLMRHYKERHGVPGYVTCCDKKFHYFYPKKIIEHMAYHLQPKIFMCPSCHSNFQTSRELHEHQSNGGRSEGKIFCPRCNDRYPTYHELGLHIITHRTDKMQCDYCGKQLKHHHRKKTINHMEDIILCSQCIRTLKSIEKQEKEIKDKVKANSNDTLQKVEKFKQAMDLSGDDDGSTD